MEKLSLDFSLLIAYILPGSLGVVTLSFYSERVQRLLSGEQGSPTATALIPLSILALGLGILVNAITWAAVRPLIEVTGAKRVAIQRRPSGERLEAYRFIIEHRFRYYQCYANVLTALVIFGASYLHQRGSAGLWVASVILLIVIVLFLAARDSLKQTYQRIDEWVNRE